MKRYSFFLYLLFLATGSFAQDQDFDNSRIADYSQDHRHLLKLYSYSGLPQNQNEHEVLILINHGYVIGFSPHRKQALWAMYQVSHARDDVSYDRIHFFSDDARIPDSARIGTDTFGNGYHLGHLVPNAAINHQYGKLAQMETFLMSNISPQKAELNTGVWLRLEDKIRTDYIAGPRGEEYGDQHVWVIVGPIFSEEPEYIERENGIQVPIPKAFFAVLVDPYRYPYDRPGNAEYMAFIFDQNVSRGQPLDDSLLVSINEIEEKTGLNLFPGFTEYYQNSLEAEPVDSVWED